MAAVERVPTVDSQAPGAVSSAQASVNHFAARRTLASQRSGLRGSAGSLNRGLSRSGTLQFEDGSLCELPPSSALASTTTRAPTRSQCEASIPEDTSCYEKFESERSTSSEAALVEKSGWLQKERPGIFKVYQPRWFVLGRKQLSWFRKPGDLVPCGVLDFELASCEVRCSGGGWPVEAGLSGSLPTPSASSSAPAPVAEPRVAGVCFGLGRSEDAGSCFELALQGYARVFSLRAASRAERDEWLLALRRHLAAAAPSQDALRLPRLSGAWWKVPRVSPDKFVETVETGDILLFRSLGVAPKIIRAFSSGNWDHVALLVRVVDEQYGPTVGLLEATGGEGVGLVLWNEFLENGWEELYPAMAIRKVQFNRSKAKLNALQKWIGDVLGKPYSLTMKKLMQRQSISAGGELNDDAFFCSQLVAEGLKVVEVVPRGVSSTQFWPSMFAAEQAPPILTCEGTALEQQWIIDFSLGETKADGGGEKRERDATTAWK